MDWTSILKALPEAGPSGLVTLICLALLFWIFWRFIPRIQDDHNAAMAQWHATHADAVVQFTKAMAEERKAFSEEIEKIRSQFDASQRGMDRFTEAVTTALRSLK